MTIETLGASGAIEAPNEGVLESEREQRESQAAEKDMRGYLEYEKRLAIQELGDGADEVSMTTDRRNEIMNEWILSGYATTWRQYAEEQVRLNRGKPIDYSRITVTNLENFADEKGIRLTKRAHIAKN